jgi:hypothetical protein
MTNGEKYKTIKKQAEEFYKFCGKFKIRGCRNCPVWNDPTEECWKSWLKIEADKVKRKRR